MSSHAPEMPILVDDETGVWTTDGLPMLYVPRHFFVNNHVAVEEALGADVYAEALLKPAIKVLISGKKKLKPMEFRVMRCFALHEAFVSARLGCFHDRVSRHCGRYSSSSLHHSAFVYQLARRRSTTCIPAGLLARSIKSRKPRVLTCRLLRCKPNRQLKTR